jgi:hypothetical protein
VQFVHRVIIGMGKLFSAASAMGFFRGLGVGRLKYMEHG